MVGYQWPAWLDVGGDLIKVQYLQNQIQNNLPKAFSNAIKLYLLFALLPFINCYENHYSPCEPPPGDACFAPWTHSLPSSHIVLLLPSSPYASGLPIHWPARKPNWIWHRETRVLYLPRNRKVIEFLVECDSFSLNMDNAASRQLPLISPSLLRHVALLTLVSTPP